MNGVTGTAQALTMLSDLNSYQLISYGIAALLGLLLAPGHQAVIEGLVSKFPLPFWIKPFIPTTLASIVSSVAAWALKNYNVTPGDAVAAAASLSFFTHIINATGLAADLEAKGKAVTAKVAAQTASPNLKSAFAFLLVAFLGLGAALHATSTCYNGDINLSVIAGMDNYAFSGAGTLLPANTGLAGGEINVGYGHFITVQSSSASGTAATVTTSTMSFQPTLVLIPLETSLDIRSGKQYLNAGLGAGYVIPTTSEPIVAILNWDLGSGQKLPYIGLVTTLATWSASGSSFKFNW